MLFIFERSWIQISAQRQTILTEVFCDFLCPFRQTTIPQIRPHPLPSTSYPKHFSLIIPSIDATNSSLMVKKPYINNTPQKIRYTVKPLFIVFVGGLKKKQWIRENNRCGNHS
jgi:hypothetical protein